jgi:glutamyl-tRNA synthetase
MDDQKLLDIFLTTLPYLENGPPSPRLDDAGKAQFSPPCRSQGARENTGRTGRRRRRSFAERPLAMDEKAARCSAGPAKDVLRGALDALRAINGEWTAAAAEAAIRAYAEHNGLKLGAVAQPLRAALTGRSTSPGVFDVLAVLGREESLGRIADQTA